MTHVLLGITGGIAAYKSCELIRLFRKKGHPIKVVMTEAAKSFISPMTFEALSGNSVSSSLFESEHAMEHIELARWADFILIAPASADFIARIAYGHANDLLTSLCLAAKIPIIIAPAMNQSMWKNSITQDNIAKLKSHGFVILDPESGEQACGEIGPGRLIEPATIIDFIENNVLRKKIFFNESKKILITAGPTQEDIDPIRFLTNHSSGKMGYALAEAAIEAGALVTLISGPTRLEKPKQVEFIAVKSAGQMHQAVMQRVADFDIFISAAAVSDYRPKQLSLHKIKKSQDNLELELVKNPDILLDVSKLNKKPWLVGFSAETENLVQHARDKLKNKNLDLIIANLVGENKGFQSDFNQVMIINKSGEINEWPFISKKELANKIMKLLAESMNYDFSSS